MRRFLATTNAASLHNDIINIRPIIGQDGYEYKWEKLWYSEECSTLKPSTQTLDNIGQQVDYRPKASYKRCECGAGSTSNPNYHSTWCPEFKK